MNEKIKDSMPVVAHYNSRYLPLTENWIHSTLRHHRMFKPVFLTRKTQNLNLFPLEKVFSLEELPFLTRLFQLGLSKLSGYIRYFLNVCRITNTAILHVHFGYQGIKFLGIKRKTGLPMVCSFYGDDAFHYPQKPGVRKKYQKLFRQADLILVLGPYMKAHLKQLGCDEQKIKIHHLGIDADAIAFRQKQRNPKEPLRFMTSCSLLEKKGVGVAIRALGLLKDRFDFTLDLVGDGPLRETLQHLARACGIADRLTWHGYKPYSFVIETMQQCDVLIQASITTSDNRKEGTPVAIMDAMATGMAVVATRHSDIPEIVADGITGLLAEENNVESLRTCFEQLFERPDLLEQFSIRGREKVEQEFHVARLTEQLEAYYLELISRQGRG